MPKTDTTDYLLYKHVFMAAMQGKTIQINFREGWKEVTLSEATALMGSKDPSEFRAAPEYVVIGDKTINAPVIEETDFFLDVTGFKGENINSMSFRVFFASGEHLHYAHTALRNLFGDKALVG